MDLDNTRFRATSGQAHGFGATPQEALNSLMGLLPDDASGPIVIWPFNRGDAFFSEAHQARLQELKSRQASLRKAERAELERLVAASFDATVARTQSISSVKS